jgi:hypothetical protein
LEKIKAMPDKAGVYELGDVKQEVVYIGSSSSSVRDRLLSHKEKTKFMRVKYFRFERAGYFEDPLEMEHRHCRLFKKAHKGKLPRLQERSPTKPWTLF